MVLMPGTYKMEEVWQHQNQWYTVKHLEYQPGHLMQSHACCVCNIS